MNNLHLFIALTALLFLLPGCSCCLAKQYFDSGTSSCRNCPYSCSACTDSNTCSACLVGYFLNSADDCQVCSAFYCQTCPNNACSACIDGYFMVHQSCVYSNNSLSIAYMVGGISLAVIVFVTCLCFCIRRCRERSLLSNIQNSSRQIVVLPEAPSQVEIRFDETWNESEGFKSKKEEACPFCLDPLVNLEIACSHLYHVECLARWLTRHNDCPICKRVVTGNAKLYCSLCFGYGICFNSALIPSEKVARKWVCERCKSQQK